MALYGASPLPSERSGVCFVIHPCRHLGGRECCSASEWLATGEPNDPGTRVSLHRVVEDVEVLTSRLSTHVVSSCLQVGRPHRGSSNPGDTSIGQQAIKECVIGQSWPSCAVVVLRSDSTDYVVSRRLSWWRLAASRPSASTLAMSAWNSTATTWRYDAVLALDGTILSTHLD